MRRHIAVVVLMTIIFGVVVVNSNNWLLEYINNKLDSCMPIMPIEVVQVVAPMTYISETEVKNILLNSNIDKVGFFSLNMKKITSGLNRNPWVNNVKVQRIWPNKIRVSFLESTPIAYNEKFVFTDNQCGVVNLTKGLKGKITQKNIPFLSTNEKNTEKLCDTLEKFQIYVKPINVSIKKIAITSRKSWYVELDNGVIVLLGNNYILDRTKRFVSFYQRFTRDYTNYGKDARMKNLYVDLRYHNGLAVGRDNAISLKDYMETA